MTEKKPDYSTSIIVGSDRQLSAPRSKLIRRGLEIAESLEKIVQTIVRNIVVEIDSDGFLKRHAILDPVSIEGKQISDVCLGHLLNEKDLSPKTLENYNYDIRIGDTIAVTIEPFRGGEPYLDKPRVVKEKRIGNEKVFIKPDKCPACGSEIALKVFRFSAVAYFCTGTACPGRIKAQLMSFFGRMGLNLNPELVKELVDKRMVLDVADFYFLKKNDLIRLNQMDEDSAQRFLDAIEKRRHPSFIQITQTLLEAGDFGWEWSWYTATQLRDIYGCNSIDDLLDDSVLAQIKSSPWINPNRIIKIINIMHDSKTLRLIEKLKRGGVVFPRRDRPLHDRATQAFNAAKRIKALRKFIDET